jgi:L-serine deaminase
MPGYAPADRVWLLLENTHKPSPPPLAHPLHALAQTTRSMNSKHKETSVAGLAVSVTLC